MNSAEEGGGRVPCGWWVKSHPYVYSFLYEIIQLSNIFIITDVIDSYKFMNCYNNKNLARHKGNYVGLHQP